MSSINNDESYQQDSLETTRESRANACRDMRDQILTLLIRSQVELGLTLEELLGSLDLVKALLLRNHFQDDEDEDE